ncbi:2,3-dihydro-2,3-dihydroxybenzoate dehydrogenase [Kurthia senegalensis]|uniref:2,3-dihydro-2,3-dihydroxybenzoate dehydrogenase n=1 Tax=Kurthia senegalensis TaxID=1033740 RepID=UPI000288BADE|nr:2,3-dihydro-2,3-dihydroxybenzoate dehydrogenase [Kurthia senegalensis]
MHKEVAVVVGGANGIGFATIQQLKANYTAIVVLDYDEEALRKLEGVTTYCVDIRDGQVVQHTIDEIEEKIGAITALIHVAGVLVVGDVCDCSDEEWDRLFDINVKGVFHVTKHVARHMKKRAKGAMVIVGSNAASTPRLDIGAYGASKAATIRYCQSLGLELAPYNIRCNIVSPGSTRTSMQTSMWQDERGEKNVIHGNLERYKVGIPLGKIANPIDIANVISFLLSDLANHITMENIVVDGGATLGV